MLQLFRFANSACGTHTGVFPSLYDHLSCDANGNITIPNLAAIWIIVANVVRIVLAAAGSIAIIMIIVGGIYYVTSAGDPGRIKKAKDIIVNTIVGLALCVTAYSVVTFIASGF